LRGQKGGRHFLRAALEIIQGIPIPNIMWILQAEAGMAILCFLMK